MALMFSRLAHNYVKNGYYPTDEESIRRISNLLQMPEKGVYACLTLAAARAARSPIYGSY